MRRQAIAMQLYVHFICAVMGLTLGMLVLAVIAPHAPIVEAARALVLQWWPK